MSDIYILHCGLNSRTSRDRNIPNTLQRLPLLTKPATFPLRTDAVHQSYNEWCGHSDTFWDPCNWQLYLFRSAQYSAQHFPLCHRAATTPFSSVLSQPLLLLRLWGWTGMGSACESQRGTPTHVSAGRGSYYACMLHWDPSNCDSRKTLHGPAWKNRCSDCKISANRETGHSHCVSSHTFYSSKLKSDWKSLYGMQRTK